MQLSLVNLSSLYNLISSYQKNLFSLEILINLLVETNPNQEDLDLISCLLLERLVFLKQNYYCFDVLQNYISDSKDIDIDFI